MFLEEIAQGIMDATLWICGAKTENLSDKVNVDNLADEIINNSSALDSKTQTMVDGMTTDEVIGHLKDVKVKSNVNEKVYNFFTGLFGLESNGNASGIGNVIYDRGADVAGKFAAGGSRAEGAANLLGHEAVHTLQARAYGGLAAFGSAYNQEMKRPGPTSNNERYYGNKFETAAYSFGPLNNTARDYVPDVYNSNIGGSTILSRSPGWWK